MKNSRPLFLLIAAMFLLVLAAGCKNQGPAAFQINDVASDPAAFDGPLTLVGIVNAISPSDATIVGVMDKKELQCTTPNCNKVILPVKTTGIRPAIGAEVRIFGSFSREPGGYLFHAETLEVLANHKLGGQG
ncbi:MAG TPA: hypothetical protein VGA63_09535 [Geopsychrobacteraceae bacterium]|jgi:hypothetical protein